METDQIQKALFSKSDAITKANVAKVLQPLHNWRTTTGGVMKVAIAVAAGELRDREGKAYSHNNYSERSAADVLNSLRYAQVEVSMLTVLNALEEHMFKHVQPGDRVAFVNQFIADVENLKDTAADLEDRIRNVE